MYACTIGNSIELLIRSTVNLMLVDSNSLPQKNRSSTMSFPTQLSFDRVVYFLGAGH